MSLQNYLLREEEVFEDDDPEDFESLFDDVLFLDWLFPEELLFELLFNEPFETDPEDDLLLPEE